MPWRGSGFQAEGRGTRDASSQWELFYYSTEHSIPSIIVSNSYNSFWLYLLVSKKAIAGVRIRP